MRYFICVNSKNRNKDYESLIRSTVNVLGEKSGDIFLVTSYSSLDAKIVKETGINYISYRNYKSKIQKTRCEISKKLINKNAGYKYVLKDFFSVIKKGDTVITVDVDICGNDKSSIGSAINSYCRKNGIKNILWCPSFEEKKTNGKVLKELNRYSYIFVSDEESYNNFIKRGIDDKKIIKGCEPKLESVLPLYKNKLLSSVNEYLKANAKLNDGFTICDKKFCSGCTACANVCPKQCITMQTDSDGFMYPSINYSVCIKCGKCRNTCPVVNKVKDDYDNKPICYAVKNKNAEILKESSSGGTFYAISKYVLDNGGVVFGAAFDEGFKVKTVLAKNETELKKLMRSKYLQSEKGDVYKEVLKELKEGKKVLFTGTPCEIGGLKAFLGKDYPNLFLQDIICHGIPSYTLFKKYLDNLEKLYGGKITDFNFRDKENGWEGYRFCVETDGNSKRYIKPSNDDYFRVFISDLSLRDACYNCSFKKIKRDSDITLADFWGIKKVIPDFFDNKGVSLIFINSEKGKTLFDMVEESLEYIEVDFEKSVKNNPSYYSSAVRTFESDGFKKDFKRLEYRKLMKKYCGNSTLSKLKRKMRKVL